MTTPAWAGGPPRTILLATDLSARCDRATDRAVQLAKAWQARLVVLTAIEPDVQEALRREPYEAPSWRRDAGPEALAVARIRREFGRIVQDADVRVVEGEPASAIDAIAEEVGAELIVTGVARDETFGRYFLGSTVERLARLTPVPLLVVKARVEHYGEILVAADFSEPSQNALTAADRFFPNAPVTVLHACEAPFAGLLDKSDFRDQWRAQEQRACEAFMERSQLTWEARARVKVLVDHGSPEALVRRYMLDRGVDLVVVGTHGYGGVFGRRLGGTAKRILAFAPGDVLLIREPRAVQRRQTT
ncbi:universal stress protein [Phenylobacterium sp. J426]|uniref:universal stress protein n=1 Tax=Phenylobacterium sp. J426 TaxID=2898439 RepID=UPI0021518686|nr:universal stress protein [Phenylobacterium sp. J426]